MITLAIITCVVTAWFVVTYRVFTAMEDEQWAAK